MQLLMRFLLVFFFAIAHKFLDLSIGAAFQAGRTESIFSLVLIVVFSGHFSVFAVFVILGHFPMLPLL